ncbi:MAG: glycosyltransferase family 4 protein [Rickettsiales bacterium]|jgi:glycosyltransferase involved in cell wall biosynthesis|nr:glycosyltransferase family 4 protein [Rickettsiales bacterium]
MKNVLFVIPTLDSGGVEIGFIEFARKNFEKKDLNIFLLCSGGSLISKVKHYNITHIAMGVNSKNPLKIFLNIGKIKKILKTHHIDLVQVESRAPAWSCFYACRALNIPLVTMVQFNGLFKETSFFKKIYNSIMFRGNPIVAVSEFVKKYALGKYKKYISRKTLQRTIEVVHRGIDVNMYSQDNISQNRKLILQNNLRLPDDKIIITLPSRFSLQKGQEYFLSSLRYLRTKNYFCLLIGDIEKNPDYVKRIEKYIYKHNLQEFVKIHENINDMPALYVLSNIVVSSSIQAESFGRTAIEAQSMGKIFVGTALGGTLETVADGETGFLAPANNAREFAMVLEKAIDLPAEEKLKITKKSRQNVIDNFSFDIMYSKMLDIYNKIDQYENFGARN